MIRLETTILKNLIHNESYMRKVLPFLKAQYFTDESEKTAYNLIHEFISKYNKPPTNEALHITLQESNLNEGIFKETQDLVTTLVLTEQSNAEWLINETEKFCKDKAVYNAILQSIGVMEGRDKNISKDGIPSLLQDALGVCFDASVGHDYFEDASSRFDFYNRAETRIPFDLDFFNKITQGGIPNKTLNIALAGCVHPDTKIRIRIRK